MSKDNDSEKCFDLEERTVKFALDVRMFLRNLPATVSNREDGKQLIRSSGSVGANYIESKESLGKKDMIMRLRIARKETKESRYWLRLLDVPVEHEQKRKDLAQEAGELLNILSSIINKVS